MEEYSFGSFFKAYPPDMDAHEVKQYIDSLHINGRLTPEMIIDDARREDSPLHCCFDWDDSIAANKWRLEQARNIISVVYINSSNPNATNPNQPIRAFVNVINDGERFYSPVKTVFSDDNQREKFLELAESELLRWQERYAALQIYADDVKKRHAIIVLEIEKLKQQREEKRKAV